MTIIVMCAATALIGMLPSYDTWGLAAPILLLTCRLLQGLGAGGEYGSAISFLYEHSPANARARNISYLVASTFLGVLTAVGQASLCTIVLGDSAFDSWGWRVLFILGLPLAAIGVYARRRVEETPHFRALLVESGRSRPKTTPTVSSYFTTFLKGPADLSSGHAYTVTLITDVVLVAAALLAGRLMDRVGLHRRGR